MTDLVNKFLPHLFSGAMAAVVVGFGVYYRQRWQSEKISELENQIKTNRGEDQEQRQRLSDWVNRIENQSIETKGEVQAIRILVEKVDETLQKLSDKLFNVVQR